jgi:hypothetical protein
MFFPTIHRSISNLDIIPFMIPELCPVLHSFGSEGIHDQWTHFSVYFFLKIVKSRDLYVSYLLQDVRQSNLDKHQNLNFILSFILIEFFL